MIAIHCEFKIFKMAAKVKKFRRLYALFFNRYTRGHKFTVHKYSLLYLLVFM